MRPSTTEYNDDGTIHRTLSPAMRAVVLAVTALPGDVDGQCVYTTTTGGPTPTTDTPTQTSTMA